MWGAPCLLPHLPTLSPDQSSEILSDYIQQSVLGGSIMIHIVTYKCDNQVPPVSTTGNFSQSSLRWATVSMATPRWGSEHGSLWIGPWLLRLEGWEALSRVKGMEEEEVCKETGVPT